MQFYILFLRVFLFKICIDYSWQNYSSKKSQMIHINISHDKEIYFLKMEVTPSSKSEWIPVKPNDPSVLKTKHSSLNCLRCLTTKTVLSISLLHELASHRKELVPSSGTPIFMAAAKSRGHLALVASGACAQGSPRTRTTEERVLKRLLSLKPSNRYKSEETFCERGIFSSHHSCSLKGRLLIKHIWGLM